MTHNSQQGVSLYLALMIMTVLFGIAFGISTILISQMKMFRAMGNSVVAFYAADTGIEKIIYAIRKQGYNPGNYSEPCGQVFDSTTFDCPALDNGATYTIEDNSAPNCDGKGANVCIGSTGKYNETNRAIEISWQ